MAFNNRKGGGFGQHNMNRRSGGPTSNMNSNFVPGGQLNAHQQQHHSQQQQRFGNNQQGNQHQGQFNQQGRQQQPLKQQAKQILNQQQQQPKPIIPPLCPELGNGQAPKNQQPPPAFKPEPLTPPVFKQESQQNQQQQQQQQHQDDAQIVEDSSQNEEGQTPKKPKPAWVKRDGKINKHERLRRRNQRLRKILQPKNALMVLNELIGTTPCEMNETHDVYGITFNCTITVDGVEHTGIGKSKPAAKAAAAEAVLKHMVLSKMIKPPNMNASSPMVIAPSADSQLTQGEGAESGDGNKMEIDEEAQKGISWSHVACYALHKLLSSWDDGSRLVDKLNQSGQAPSGGSIAGDSNNVPDKRPAKKLPETADTMNPIMLLNQMVPGVKYDEVSKVGNPPNTAFTLSCVIGSDTFYGTASTKKGAKKICAFAACRKILGIQYSQEFLEENNFSENAVQVGFPA